MNSMKLFFQRRIAAFFLAAALPTLAFAAPELTGVGNFQKVDDHVYRGAQPTDQGFLNLAKLGIATVVDLREAGDRVKAEERVVTAAGMHYISVPMRGMETPSDESVAKVLTLLEDQATGPVFVHCQRGADRTGGVIACYRVEHDHWKNDRAVSEARSLGMSWYQRAIQRYVLNFKPRSIGTGAPNTLEAIASTPSTPGLIGTGLHSVQ
jgi:tyrosine-protein phosphatase SIW14